MVALLQANAPVESVCPFGFLLPSDKSVHTEAPLVPHLEWLRQNQLLSAGGEALTTRWQRAMTILARPCRRICVTNSAEGKAHRVMFVSDGEMLIFAMFDRQHCLISEPFSYDVSVERLLRTIGVPEVEEEQLQPLCTSPDVMRLMGALAEAGLVERPSKAHGKDNTRSVRALSERRAEEVLGDVLGDPAIGSALLVDMMADKLILAERQKVWVHPQFAPWHRAISSGAMLEVVRQELPQGQPSSASLEKQRGVFLGPAQRRCLTWPSPSQPGEVILAYPTHKQLRHILLFLLGAPNNNDASLQETLARSSQKFSFRG